MKKWKKSGLPDIRKKSDVIYFIEMQTIRSGKKKT